MVTSPRSRHSPPAAATPSLQALARLGEDSLVSRPRMTRLGAEEGILNLLEMLASSAAPELRMA